MFSQNLIFVRCPFEERKIPPLIYRRDNNIMWWSSQWLKSQFHQLKNCEWLNPYNLENTYHTTIKLFDQHLIWIYSIYPLRDYSYIINIKIRVRPPVKQMTRYSHRCMDLSAGSTIGMSLRILEKPEHLIESCHFVICFQEFWKI